MMSGKTTASTIVKVSTREKKRARDQKILSQLKNVFVN